DPSYASELVLLQISVSFTRPVFVIFFSRPAHHRDLHSFPTRRSSDLGRHIGSLCGVTPAERSPSRRSGRRSRAWYAPCPSCPRRSEEHTSELQSRGHLVCRLLLEKKKNASKSWRVGGHAMVHVSHTGR